MKLRKTVLFTVLHSLATAGVLCAQTETGFQFNLSTPGARSLAMGGAFVGLADDATAAYTNPAGLANLTLGGSEVAVETRSWEYSTRFIERGHLGGTAPFGVGIDTVPGLESAEADSKASGLSFLSVGYLLPRGVTLALYHHQLARYRTASLAQGIFDIEPDATAEDCQNSPLLLSPQFFNTCRVPPTSRSVDLQILNDGLSASRLLPLRDWRGRHQSLSLGAGVSYYQMELAARTRGYFFQGFTGLPALDRQAGGFFGPADLLSDNLAWTVETKAEDAAWGLSLGLLWQLEPHWSVGAVYRQGPRFTFGGLYRSGPALQSNYGVPLDTQLPVPAASLRVPDVYGLGVAYRTLDGNRKIALDVNRVRYSQRLPDFGSTGGELRIDDALEAHLGVEQVMFVFPSQMVGTLRLGVWHEPFHEPVGQATDAKVFFPKGKAELHGSGGLGLVIREDFQIDAAVDLGDRVKTFSFSLVYFL